MGLVIIRKDFNQSKGSHLGYEKVQRLDNEFPLLGIGIFAVGQLAFGSLSKVGAYKFDKVF